MTLDWDWAERFLGLGFYLSFAGLVTRPSRNALRDVVKQCPADRLLLETDSPYGQAHNRMGVPNRPAYLLDTATLVADYKQFLAVFILRRRCLLIRRVLSSSDCQRRSKNDRD